MSQMRAIVDRLLSGASSGYMPKGYISERVLPLVPVTETSGLLGRYGTSHLRIETTLAGGRGKYRVVEAITRSTVGYLVESHGLQGIVTRNDKRNVLTPFDAEMDETVGLTILLWLRKEYGLASTLADTSIITQNTTLSGTSQFSDYENSDPITKFSVARTALLNAGAKANKAIVPALVYDKLRYHPQMLDALGFKFARPGGLKPSELAVAMEVDEVLIPEALYETAAEGQTSSLAQVWGKHVHFICAPDSADRFQKSLGYRVQMAGKAPRQVYKWPENNPPESTNVLCEDEYDMLISDATCAYLIKDAIA